MKKKIFIILISILVLAVFSGGILFYLKNRSAPNNEVVPGDTVKVSCKNGPLPDEILNNLEFQKYINELVKANPGLKIEEFECVEKQIAPSRSESGAAEPMAIWNFSPDGKKAVTTLMSFGEPDSDLVLYNRNNDQKNEWLGSCGTPCYWLNAFWLNNKQFIAIFSSEYFGSEKKCNVSDGICLEYRLELYDLVKNSVNYYYFPGLFESHLRNPWRQEQCEKVFGEGNSYCK